jgi:hypothetical protein
MALIILFLSGDAVNLFKVKKAILYEDKIKDRRRPTLNLFHKLVTTININIIELITFRHLRLRKGPGRVGVKRVRGLGAPDPLGPG